VEGTLLVGVSLEDGMRLVGVWLEDGGGVGVGGSVGSVTGVGGVPSSSPPAC